MDGGSIIVGTILFIVVFVLPFVLINSSTKKREKKLAQLLYNLATTQNCQISQLDCWDESAIGLDETNGMLFFYRRLKEGEISQQIKLSEMQNCRLIHITRNVGSGNSQHKVIDQVGLSLLPRAKGKPEVRLEFFNAETNIQFNQELQLGEKWQKKLNERLK